VLKSLHGRMFCRPFPNGGKAEAAGEETSKGTLWKTGIGVQAPRERDAEIRSGRSWRPAAEWYKLQGLDDERKKLSGGFRTGT
jgi:hypothetical protein